MALNGLICADVPLSNYSLTQYVAVLLFRWDKWGRRVGDDWRPKRFSVCSVFQQWTR